MIQRKIFTLFFVLVFVGLFVAGPLFGAGSKQSVDRSPDSVEVVFWHYNSGLLGEAMTTLVQRFNSTTGME